MISVRRVVAISVNVVDLEHFRRVAASRNKDGVTLFVQNFRANVDAGIPRAFRVCEMQDHCSPCTRNRVHILLHNLAMIFLHPRFAIALEVERFELTLGRVGGARLREHNFGRWGRVIFFAFFMVICGRHVVVSEDASINGGTAVEADALEADSHVFAVICVENNIYVFSRMTGESTSSITLRGRRTLSLERSKS